VENAAGWLDVPSGRLPGLAADHCRVEPHDLVRVGNGRSIAVAVVPAPARAAAADGQRIGFDIFKPGRLLLK